MSTTRYVFVAKRKILFFLVVVGLTELIELRFYSPVNPVGSCQAGQFS